MTLPASKRISSGSSNSDGSPTLETTWDAVVASALRRTSTETNEKSSRTLATLALRIEPKVEWLPRVYRTASAVPAVVGKSFEELIRGKAPWPLFLYGPAGTGKTCAGLCLLDHAWGEFWTAATLAQTVIEVMHGRLTWHHEGRTGNYTLTTFWRRLATAPLIVLDEIGCRDRVSDHHYECVQRLLDDRAGMPLIAISNLDREKLAGLYDDRISSRLSVGTVVHLTGDDRRLQ